MTSCGAVDVECNLTCFSSFKETTSTSRMPADDISSRAKPPLLTRNEVSGILFSFQVINDSFGKVLPYHSTPGTLPSNRKQGTLQRSCSWRSYP